MDSRYYPGVEADVSKLVAELRGIFDQDYEVQNYARLFDHSCSGAKV